MFSPAIFHRISAFFSPATISSCIPQTTMCSSATFLTLLSLLPLDSAFCSTTQHLAYSLALVFVCIPATISFFIVPFRGQLICTGLLTSFFNDVFNRILSAVNGIDAPTLLSVSFDIKPTAHSTCCRWILYRNFSSTARGCFTSKCHLTLT